MPAPNSRHCSAVSVPSSEGGPGAWVNRAKQRSPSGAVSRPVADGAPVRADDAQPGRGQVLEQVELEAEIGFRTDPVFVAVVDPQHAAIALDVGDEVGVVEAAFQQVHLDRRGDGVLPLHELAEVVGVQERMDHAHSSEPRCGPSVQPRGNGRWLPRAPAGAKSGGGQVGTATMICR